MCFLSFPATAVNFICDHPSIKAISFVGSNQAGEYIYGRGSQNGKRVQSNMVREKSTGNTGISGGTLNLNVQEVAALFNLMFLLAFCLSATGRSKLFRSSTKQLYVMTFDAVLSSKNCVLVGQHVVKGAETNRTRSKTHIMAISINLRRSKFMLEV